MHARACCASAACRGTLKTNIAQVWRVPGETQWSMTYTFFDGVGYQTALAHSDDLLHWNQSPGTVYSPRADRPPMEWVAQPGDFDCENNLPANCLLPTLDSLMVCVCAFVGVPQTAGLRSWARS